MYKQFILTATIAAILLALAAQAAKAQEPTPKRQAEVFMVQGQPMPKLEAIRTMIVRPEAQVMRCVEIKLSAQAKVVRK